MYTKGLITLSDEMYDSRNSDMPGTVAYLPHSCDSWVIGKEEQVELMILDLQEILIELRNVKK